MSRGDEGNDRGQAELTATGQSATLVKHAEGDRTRRIRPSHRSPIFRRRKRFFERKVLQERTASVASPVTGRSGPHMIVQPARCVGRS
jgi:hypothetical protein